MESLKDNFKLEEYKQIRDEITARERAIVQLASVAIVVSLALLSAIATVFYGKDPNQFNKLSFEYAFVFLAPLLVIIPIFYIIVSHRRDLHRAGSYIHVFYEEASLGPQWETQLAKFRKVYEKESLARLPLIFWFIAFFSIIGAISALFKMETFACYRCELIISAVILLAPLVHATWEFSNASSKLHDKYCDDWRRIRDEPKKEQ